MIEKICRTAKRTAFFLGLGAAGVFLSAAAARSFSERVHIRSEKINGNIYIIRKNVNPKVVCVTNQSPVIFAINVIKRHLNG